MNKLFIIFYIVQLVLVICLGIGIIITIITYSPEPIKTTTQQVKIYQVFIPVMTNNYTAPHTSNKKGIAPNYWYPEDWERTGAKWTYVYSSVTWSPKNEVESIPMVRASNPTNPIGGGNSEWLLGDNEPDLNTEITLLQQVKTWHDVVEPSGRKLVSPAPSHLHPEWLVEFRNLYYRVYKQYPHFDALAIHCYTTVGSCQELVTYIISLADDWQVADGVWVTEFAFYTPKEMELFVLWMENQPRVARYAWYTNRLIGDEPWCPNCLWMTLFDYKSGEMTKLGKMYAKLP